MMQSKINVVAADEPFLQDATHFLDTSQHEAVNFGRDHSASPSSSFIVNSNSQVQQRDHRFDAGLMGLDGGNMGDNPADFQMMSPDQEGGNQPMDGGEYVEADNSMLNNSMVDQGVLD